MVDDLDRRISVVNSIHKINFSSMSIHFIEVDLNDVRSTVERSLAYRLA